jgi:uncharacterized GH25 family protein
MTDRARRVILGTIAACALVAVAVVVGLRARHRGAAVGAATKKDGGAAIHAPAGPQLPGVGDPGTHLAGFVVDGAGLPVPGAEVSAEPEKGVVDRALATTSAGSASGSAAAADAGVAAAPDDAGAAVVAVSPATGADGQFVISGIAPGRYRVRVTGPGLLPAEVRYVPVPSDAVRIVIARQVTIEGTVTDGGKPVIRANVGIRSEAIGGTLDVMTDVHGAFSVPELPEGRYQVYAYLGALAARTVRVNRLGAGPFQPVELRLEAGAVVVGRVIDKDEGTGLLAAVELRPSGEDQAPRYARTGADGVFRIEGVPNGRWIADAFAPGYLSATAVELDAGKGIPEVALVRGATIEGRVLDGDGHPVEGASVRALAGTTNPTELSEDVDLDRLRRFSGRTAAPVSDVGPASDPQLVPRGELGVMVGPIPPIPPPGAQAAQPAALSGPSLVGEPPPLEVDPARASIWTTGADGRYRIRGIAKGKAAVLASAVGFAEARSKQVTLGGGEVATGIDIVLTAGTVVAGRVTDARGPIAGAQVSVTPEVGAPIEGFTDDAGEFKLGPVTGKIELAANAYGHVDVKKTLELAATKGTTPAERREDLVLAIADATLAGTLDDALGAPVNGATLEVLGAGEGRRGLVEKDGTFSIDMLPPGKLRVRVTHPDYPPAELEAEATTTGVSQRLRLPLGGGIDGALVDDQTGAPLAGIAISATGPGGTVEATTDKDGRYRLVPLRPGSWRIDVKLPGYRAQSRDVDVQAARTPGTTTVHDIRIDLARGALVGGLVRDSRGQRVAGAHVVVKGATTSVDGDTDAQGEFRLHDCPTGDLVVSAERGDLHAQTKVTVRAGSEVLTLQLELK